MAAILLAGQSPIVAQHSTASTVQRSMYSFSCECLSHICMQLKKRASCDGKPREPHRRDAKTLLDTDLTNDYRHGTAGAGRL